MLQIYYIQDYQKIEIIPWWGKKKSQIWIPLLVFLLIQNVEKSIHTQHQMFSKRIGVQTFSASSAVVFHTIHTSVAPFSVCICSLGSGVCLLGFFSPPLPFSFIFQQEEKGKETGVGRTRLCNRRCPLKIQLEQTFSVADRFKTDVSFIIMQSGGKQRKRKWLHPPECCEFCTIQRVTFFILKELKMCSSCSSY